MNDMNMKHVWPLGSSSCLTEALDHHVMAIAANIFWSPPKKGWLQHSKFINREYDKPWGFRVLCRFRSSIWSHRKSKKQSCGTRWWDRKSDSWLHVVVVVDWAGRPCCPMLDMCHDWQANVNLIGWRGFKTLGECSQIWVCTPLKDVERECGYVSKPWCPPVHTVMGYGCASSNCFVSITNYSWIS